MRKLVWEMTVTLKKKDEFQYGKMFPIDDCPMQHFTIAKQQNQLVYKNGVKSLL